jgi:hypothetical protein
MEDPVGQLLIPFRTDTVDVEITQSALKDALYQLTDVTGYVFVADQSLQGTLDLKGQQTPLADLLTQIATKVNGKFRPVYVLSRPRQLSEAEQEQRMDQRFNSRWAQFWAKPPAERKADMDQQIERINRWAEAARQPGQDGQPTRAARALQRMGPRMISRMSRYVTSLSPEQRAEIKPLMKAMSHAVNPQGQQ